MPSTMSTGSLEQAGGMENVDGILSDYMEKLATRLAVLETELRYAWKALDLLSQEYVVMWNRMEKAETLLSQQQGIISRMMEEQLQTEGEQGEPPPAPQPTSSDTSKKDSKRGGGGNGDDDGNNGGGGNNGGSAGGSGSLGGGGGAYGGSSSGGGGSSRHDGRNTKTPDEAFYRSLNVAHRDSGPGAVGEQELSLIWEEDADVLEKTELMSEIGRKGGSKERLSSEVDSIKSDSQSHSAPSDSQLVFSSLDYKDYRVGTHGSPCISDKDIEELSTISSLEAKDIMDSIDRLRSPSKTLHHHHHTDSSAAAASSSYKTGRPPLSSGSSTLLSSHKRSALESPQRRAKTSRTRPKGRSTLEESLRLLYMDSDSGSTDFEMSGKTADRLSSISNLSNSSSKLDQHHPTTAELLYSCSRTSPVPMEVDTSSGSMLSTRAVQSPSSRLSSSSCNDYMLTQELMRDALRASSPSSYRPPSRLSETGGTTDQEVAAALIGTNYDPLGRISMSLSRYESAQSSTPYSSDSQGTNGPVNAGSSATLRTRQDGYLGGRPVSPLPLRYGSSSSLSKSVSPSRSPSKLHATPDGHGSPSKSTSSPRKVSPRNSGLYSDSPLSGVVDTISLNRVRDPGDILVMEGSVQSLQMPTVTHVAASPRLSPVADYTQHLNDLSMSASSDAAGMSLAHPP
ncbi:hypothetical protein Ocin01_09114 [Orchesella cincta]|uniref:Uncharacterized protein n=1 Tax=Orchesella cincta TaxID=48709 RepID=A0A1D2MXN9_ORCCI|nr:hypothetical protein Ocin01_09114 [Orchesella cincta]